MQNPVFTLSHPLALNKLAFCEGKGTASHFSSDPVAQICDLRLSPLNFGLTFQGPTLTSTHLLFPGLLHLVWAECLCHKANRMSPDARNILGMSYHKQTRTQVSPETSAYNFRGRRPTSLSINQAKTPTPSPNLITVRLGKGRKPPPLFSVNLWPTDPCNSAQHVIWL